LDQDQVTTQTGRKSVLVAHYVVSTAVTNESSYIVSTRDVSSFRIQWISIGPVKLVGEKGQWICIEAFLCGHLSVRDSTCLESKVTHVVSSEHTLKGDVGFWSEAALGNSGHDSSDGIRRQVVVVITYKPTAGFGATNIEAVRACLNSRIGFGSTRPLSLDAGVVVS
jgi:hypothetical protein